MQVEGYAADSSLVSRDIRGRFLYVSQVYQSHGASLSAWVGQQSIVRAGAEAAQACGTWREGREEWREGREEWREGREEWRRGK